MKNYICKWPNGDVVLISAVDKQQVREVLDEVGDPGACEIVRLKGPFAIELIPQVPHPPPPAEGYHNPGPCFPGDAYEAPEDPTVRPSIMRWAGNRGESFYADVYQEVGGQLSTDEAAALQRWRAATGGAAQAANSDEPWVTEQQLQEAGLLDNPYYVQVRLGGTEYGHYSSHLLKKITKNFFPNTHQALKPLAEADCSMSDGGDTDEAVRDLCAAVAADVDDKEKAREQMRKRAKLMVDAQAGDRNALLQLMTDQTANVYGPEADDEDDDFDDDEGDDDNDSDEDAGMGIVNAIRAGRAMELAAALGVNRQ